MHKQMRPKNQHEIDAKALSEGKAIANNSPGGESMDPKRDDMHQGQAKKPAFRGIRLHDKDHNTWGV